MIRKDIYTIGRKKAEKQQVGRILHIDLNRETETEVGDGDFSFYYDVLFGTDDKGRMYMILATKEWGCGEWHGAYRSGGHWHSAGCSHFIRQYHVKLRKNFETKEEANHYYNIVYNMTNFTVQDNKYFTEAQIDRLFK